jgi:hypothetical protein
MLGRLLEVDGLGGGIDNRPICYSEYASVIPQFECGKWLPLRGTRFAHLTILRVLKSLHSEEIGSFLKSVPESRNRFLIEGADEE